MPRIWKQAQYCANDGIYCIDATHQFTMKSTPNSELIGQTMKFIAVTTKPIQSV